MGGWDQLRARLKGNGEGDPMMFIFDHCRDLIRTLPMLQHDPHNAEDVDTTQEDHAPDAARYGCLSRPRLRQSRSARSASSRQVSQYCLSGSGP